MKNSKNDKNIIRKHVTIITIMIYWCLILRVFTQVKWYIHKEL